MKKIGKKFSFLTKILLVLGMLFSNLSSLSVVFASEVIDDFTVALDSDKEKVEINYLEEVDDTDEITVEIKENYTYLDDTREGTQLDEFSTTGLEIKNILSRTSKMMSLVKFDGLYEVSVSLDNVTDNKTIGTVTHSENIRFDVGLKLESLVDSANNPVTFDATTDEYSTDDSILKATFKIQAGGLYPNQIYTLGEIQYSAVSLLNEAIVENIDFTNHLKGKHTVEVERKITDKLGDEIVLSTNIEIFYGTYVENDTMINTLVSSLGLSGKYLFDSTGLKDGKIIVMGNPTTKYTLLDIFNIAENIMTRSTGLTYMISTSEYNDVRDEYLNYVDNYVGEPTEMLTENEFFSDIELTDGMILSLSCDDLTITYSTLFLGDINNDGLITDEDITLLIDKAIGKDTTPSDNTNLYVEDPETIDIKDVITLKSLKNNGTINSLVDRRHTVDARLDVVNSDITSGDTFTVSYIIKAGAYGINAFQGLVNYDETKLELVSIEKELTTLIGNNFEGKFLYLNDTELNGTSSINANNQVIWADKEYNVLTITFKALKAGTSTVSIKDYQFFNDNDIVLYSGTNIETDVTINASDDNTLGSLSVAGKNIQLDPEILEYTLIVENEVTEPNIQAIANNIAAEISSKVVPEQLSVGENKITLTVTAENGDVRIYTIIVTRKEAPKPTQTSYQPDDNDEDVVTPPSSSSSSSSSAEKDTPKDENKVSRVIIIVLILGIIGGLVYLIFKDESDDEKKKANRDINKLKKEPIVPPKKTINVEPQKEKKIIKEIKNPVNKPQSKNNKTGKSNKPKER